MTQVKRSFSLINRKYKKPTLVGFLVFISFLLLGSFIFWQRYQILLEERHREITGLMQEIKSNIENTLKSSYSAAWSQALLIDGNGQISDFEESAPKLLEANPNLDGLQLVPDGVITKVYPLQKNREALNYDILADSTRNEEAKIAIQRRKMYFAGPFELRQGGMAVVGRLPVFIEDQFWGFSAVIIKFDHLLKQAGFFRLSGKAYKFQFSKIDPDTGEEVFYLPGDTPSNSYSENTLLTDGNWKIYIAPKNEFAPFLSLLPLAALILFLSIWLGWYMRKILMQPEELRAKVKAQSKEIIESEHRFQRIFNQAAIGMAQMNTRNGKFIETNDRFRNLSGYTREELKDLDYKQLSHPEEITENQELMQKLLRGEIREYSLEKRAFKKDGSIVWIRLTVSPLWQPGDKPGTHIAIIEDITQRKEAEIELNKSYKMLMDQNRRLVNFSYIISHDLRSHSSNIQSILELYNTSEVEEEKESYIELLSKVTSNLNQTLGYLNEVVSIQKNPNLKKEPLELLHFVEKGLDLLEIQILEEKAEVIVDVPKEAKVNFNSAYLESVILNFISNSLRYSDQQRRLIIEIKAYERAPEKWVLEITDNGIGIDLERNREKLFGLYKTFTDRNDSRGIGLFITKHQVEAMDGEIEVESTPGNGTTFKVIFA